MARTRMDEQRLVGVRRARRRAREYILVESTIYVL